ncbi:MAG: sulfatase [Chloroflexi bacterium]|nr:sulfatase [Chloroflexota bacterium]
MNVICIVADSLRKDHVGCYGTTAASAWFTARGGAPVQTPNLDRLAAEGTLFERAYPESLPTVPVRRALHTGRRAFPFRDWRPVKWDIVYLPGWQPIPHDQDTVAERLARAGYRTAFVTDTLPYFAPGLNFTRGFHQWHFVRGQQQDRYHSLSRAAAFGGPDADPLARFVTGPRHRERLRHTLTQYLANVSGRRAEEDWFAPRVYRQAMRWLEENHEVGREGRLFLLIDHFDPHEPWDPPRHYVELYDPGYRPGRDGADVIHPMYGVADWLSEAELRHLRANYAGEVAMVDHWLGRLLDKIDVLGLRDNTLVVFISDHGHLLGEHGLVGKLGHALYPELIDIPLLIRHPNGKPGRRVHEPVYNLDIVPTMLAAAGVPGTTWGDAVDGRDLTPLLTGADGWRSRQYLTSAYGTFAWIQTGDYVLNAGVDGAQPRLIVLHDDPGHERNLAGERPDLVRELFALLRDDAGGDLPAYERPMTYADGSRPT